MKTFRNLSRALNATLSVYSSILLYIFNTYLCYVFHTAYIVHMALLAHTTYLT